jgi:hypothetical protein
VKDSTKLYLSFPVIRLWMQFRNSTRSAAPTASSALSGRADSPPRTMWPNRAFSRPDPQFPPERRHLPWRLCPIRLQRLPFRLSAAPVRHLPRLGYPAIRHSLKPANPFGELADAEGSRFSGGRTVTLPSPGITAGRSPASAHGRVAFFPGAKEQRSPDRAKGPRSPKNPGDLYA